MRRVLPLLTLLLMVVPSVGCRRRDGQGRSWELPDLVNLGGHRVSASWSQDDLSVSFHLRGRAAFNDEENDLVSLSTGGKVRLKVRKNGVTSTFEATAKHGVLRRTLDGKPVEGEQAKAWLGIYLPEVFRRTGLEAERRAERIFAKGGGEAMAAEIPLLQGSYTKRTYLEAWLRKEGSSGPAVQRMVALAGREMESSYELATFLVHAMEQSRDDASRAAAAQAAARISSDYEHRRALSAILKSAQVTETVAQEVLAASAGIESDFEKATLLQESMELCATSKTAAAAIQSAKDIHSSYELGRVVQAIASCPKLDGPTQTLLIHLAKTISSDFEKANALMAIQERQKPQGAVKQGLQEAAQSITSDYERGRVLSALGN